MWFFKRKKKEEKKELGWYEVAEMRYGKKGEEE